MGKKVVNVSHCGSFNQYLVCTFQAKTNKTIVMQLKNMSRKFTKIKKKPDKCKFTPCERI